MKNHGNKYNKLCFCHKVVTSPKKNNLKSINPKEKKISTCKYMIHFTMKEIEKIVYERFLCSHLKNKNVYNIKKINEIIFNVASHLVAEYKDYLIKGDNTEFIQRFYPLNESIYNLQKITDYYKNSSIIFPNYVMIPESKYIYKNYQRKLKIIDFQKEIESEEGKKKNLIKIQIKEDKLFITDIFDSIMNQTNTSIISLLFGISKSDKDEKLNEDDIGKLIDRIKFSESIHKKFLFSSPKKYSNIKKGNEYRNNNNKYNEFKSKSIQKENNKQTIPYMKFVTSPTHLCNRTSLMNSLINSKKKKTKSKDKKKSAFQDASVLTSKSSKSIKMSSSSSAGMLNILNSKTNKSMPKLQNLIHKNFKYFKMFKSKEFLNKKEHLLTSREPQPLSKNHEMANTPDSKNNKMKRNLKRTSSSISSKKANPNSSVMSAIGSYKTNNKNDEKAKNISPLRGNNQKYISVSRRNKSQKNATTITKNIGNDKQQRNVNEIKKVFSQSPRNEVQTTYTHIPSCSSIFGINQNIIVIWENTKEKSNNLTKNYKNLKDIHIKGFNELFKSGKKTPSRNFNSERFGVTSTINGFQSSYNGNHQGYETRKNGYFKIFSTSIKVKD